jgi:hypothetical protein
MNLSLLKKHFSKAFLTSAFIMSASLFFANSLFAEDTQKFEHSLTVDGAYYIKSDFKKGDDHIANPTGPFDGILAKATWASTYTIPTPLGQSPLLSSADIELKGSMEISPLSIRPIATITFSPLPFLLFDAGASIGTGWNLIGFEGFCVYKNGHYKNLTPFTHYYHTHWLGATFQFDTGAIFDGEWSHILLYTYYQMIYQGITGLDKGTFWAWQTTEGFVNGLGYDFTAMIGYQTPLFVDMVGFMANLYGQYSKKDYGDWASTYDKFMIVKLNLFARLALNQKNSLLIAARTSSRRSFTTAHKKGEEEPHLIKSGREWYFDCIALSWKHEF